MPSKNADNSTVLKATILLTQEELDLIDLWRIENHVESRTSAVRRLLGIGCRDYFTSGDEASQEADNGKATGTGA